MARSAFRWLDHTADVGIEFEGRTLPAVFRVATKAYAQLVAPEARLRATVERPIRVVAAELPHVVVRWFGELIYALDAERYLPLRAIGVSVGRPSQSDRGGAPWIATGRLVGVKLDRERVRLEREIKAATYHAASLERTRGGAWRARIVFDI